MEVKNDSFDRNNATNTTKTVHLNLVNVEKKVSKIERI